MSISILAKSATRNDLKQEVPVGVESMQPLSEQKGKTEVKHTPELQKTYTNPRFNTSGTFEWWRRPFRATSKRKSPGTLPGLSCIP
jgi:hypothetical protein